MKILSTQLTGLFQRISSQEQAVEDTARLLAQAAAGEGSIYLAAFGEMKSVAAAALEGKEPLAAAAEWRAEITLTGADRVWILATRDEGDELARKLADASIPFAMLVAESTQCELPDAFISLAIDRGILPTEDGGRMVVPHSIGALFVYHAVKMDIDEMLAE